MIRLLGSLILDVLLTALAVAAAYLVEETAYASSSQSWTVHITMVGLVWFLLVGIVLTALSLTNGIFLNRHREKHAPEPSGGHKGILSSWQDKAARPSFTRYAATFFSAVFLLVLGIRGLGLEGKTSREPSQVVFLHPEKMPPPTTVVSPALTVFFENGRKQVSGSNKVLVDRLATMAVACGIETIELSSNASSARFRSNHEKKNVGLANDRELAVENEIKLITKRKVTISHSPWETEPPMAAVRWLLDAQPTGERLLAAEPFNRRVDIVIKNRGRCEPAAASSPSLP
jgi:hypothetical protein